MTKLFNNFPSIKSSVCNLKELLVFKISWKTDSFKTKFTRDFFTKKFVYDKYFYFIYIFILFALIYLFFNKWVALFSTLLFNFVWEFKNSFFICRSMYCKKICLSICGLGFSVRNFLSGLFSSFLVFMIISVLHLHIQSSFVVFILLLFLGIFFYLHCLKISGVFDLSFKFDKNSSK